MFCRAVGATALVFVLISNGFAESGVVVLEDTPSCDHFVIETSRGYTLAEWYGGVNSIWEGDGVYGNLSTYGFHTIYIDGRGEMRVWIDDYWESRAVALKYFYRHCK